MAASMFIHFYNNGDVWVSNCADFTPGTGPHSSQKSGTESGSSIGVFRVNPDAQSQKLTTLSGTVSSSLAVTGSTGKYPSKEIV